MINKIIGAVKSRTVWTIVALVIINGAPSVRDLVPQQYLVYLNGLLGLLAVYFRVNPKQQF